MRQDDQERSSSDSLGTDSGEEPTEVITDCGIKIVKETTKKVKKAVRKSIADARNKDLFMLHNDSIKQSVMSSQEFLKHSRRESIDEVDYRSAKQREADKSENRRALVHINDDSEEEDSSDDEALKAAKRSVYAREQRNNLDSDFSSESDY